MRSFRPPTRQRGALAPCCELRSRSLAAGGRRRRSAILGAVLLATALAAPAARAEWSAPLTISQPHDQISDLLLASGPGGELLSWTYWDALGTKGMFGPPNATYAVAPPGGSFGTERRLPSSYTSPQMVDLGDGRLAHLIRRPAGGNTERLQVALGSVHGGFGRPMAIPGVSGSLGRASLAGDAQGELLIAWIATDSHNRRIVWASERSPGGRFGAAQVVSGRAQAEQVNAALGASGDLVVAFPNKWGRMLARVRRHGQAWGALQNLGRAAGGTENDVTPFVGHAGRVIVVWYETQLCSGGCVSPGFTRVAVQPAGSSRFRHAQLLERDGTGIEGAPSGISLSPSVLSVGGRAPIVIFLAAGASSPTHPPLAAAAVKVAYPLGLAYSSPQTISAPDQQARDVGAAAGPKGAIVTWIRVDLPGNYYGTVFAARSLSPTGPFGAPEQISPSEHVLSATPSFNSASRWPRNSIAPWTVAWTSRPQGESTHTLVRVSSPLCPLGTSPAPVTAATLEPMCFGT